MRDSILFGLGLLLALGGPVSAVLQKEHILRNGQVVLLELAPRDPRSLMQGDYMDLDYGISRKLQDFKELPKNGYAVLKNDEKGIAVLQRLHSGEALAPGEFLLRFRRRGFRIRLGAESFFFQEGQADRFQPARYGELRVDGKGGVLLSGLRDKELKPLGNPRR